MFGCSPAQHGDREKVDHRVIEIRRLAVVVVQVPEMVTEVVVVVPNVVAVPNVVVAVPNVVEAVNVEENGDVVVRSEIHSVLAPWTLHRNMVLLDKPCSYTVTISSC